jgi:hypothetical protein
MNRIYVWIVAAAAAAGINAAPAAAQGGVYNGQLSVQLGGTSGGDMPSASVTPSLSVAVHETTGWGAELDFGFANGKPTLANELDLTTYMVNITWLAPSGIVRPYGVGGAGVIQVHGCFFPCPSIATVYDIGVNFGGGALYTINDLIGVRGDVRYFIAPGDKSGFTRPGNYSFWRVSAGVTIHWSITP